MSNHDRLAAADRTHFRTRGDPSNCLGSSQQRLAAVSRWMAVPTPAWLSLPPRPFVVPCLPLTAGEHATHTGPRLGCCMGGVGWKPFWFRFSSVRLSGVLNWLALHALGLLGTPGNGASRRTALNASIAVNCCASPSPVISNCPSMSHRCPIPPRLAPNRQVSAPGGKMADKKNNPMREVVVSGPACLWDGGDGGWDAGRPRSAGDDGERLPERAPSSVSRPPSTHPLSNNMQVEKLILNCCVGESGDRLTRAAKVLEQLSGQTPVYSKGACVRVCACCWFGGGVASTMGTRSMHACTAAAAGAGAADDSSIPTLTSRLPATPTSPPHSPLHGALVRHPP